MPAVTQPAFHDRRARQRSDLGRPGTLRLGERVLSIVVSDLTRDGCRIETQVDLPRGGEIMVGIAGIGLTPARAVWRNARGYGCEFLAPLARGAITAAFADNVASLPAPSSAPASQMERSAKWPAVACVALIVAAVVATWAVLAIVLIHSVG